MNDRFKFRVWYKPYNGYVEKRDDLVLLSDGILCEYDGIEIDSDNYIIEQCTGFSDKNGNLIYEGDCVGFYVYGQNEKWYGGEGTVIWYNSSWGIETSSRFICFENNIPMANPQSIEIIGNIHEQAEQNDTEAD